MTKEPKIYITDILEAIVRIRSFISFMSYSEFEKNDLVNSAVVRQLEIIGEAAKNIEPRLRAKYPNIPWADMCKTRDKLIHAYSGVDLEIVYTIASKELPQLEKVLKEMRDGLK